MFDVEALKRVMATAFDDREESQVDQKKLLLDDLDALSDALHIRYARCDGYS